jgi:hypothetical protein
MRNRAKPMEGSMLDNRSLVRNAGGRIRSIVATTLGIAAMGLIAAPASSASGASCGERTQVLAELAKQFSEAPIAMGLSDRGGVVELFNSPAGDTWTILITLPNGKSCMVLSGAGWEPIPLSTRGASL